VNRDSFGIAASSGLESIMGNGTRERVLKLSSLSVIVTPPALDTKKWKEVHYRRRVPGRFQKRRGGVVSLGPSGLLMQVRWRASSCASVAASRLMQGTTLHVHSIPSGHDSGCWVGRERHLSHTGGGRY
jgi:hypothetical protein